MYLEQRAEEDALFAKKYRNPAKNMDECVTHILNYVQKSGCNGFTDGEIFGQAIHYYEENEIEVGKPMNCQVVVNHVVELTEEEKADFSPDTPDQTHCNPEQTDPIHTQANAPYTPAHLESHESVCCP